jgi:flagellar protein FliO/FliZ
MFKWLRGSDAHERSSRRVAVIDAIPVDRSRSVVLVRCDNIEHLLLIGGRADMVVEPNIIRATATREPARPTASGPARPAAKLSNRLTPVEVPRLSPRSPASRVDAPRLAPLAESPAAPEIVDGLAELTRQLEAALHRSSAPEGRPPITHYPTVPPPKNALNIKHPKPELMTEPKSAEPEFKPKLETS